MTDKKRHCFLEEQSLQYEQRVIVKQLVQEIQSEVIRDKDIWIKDYIGEYVGASWAYLRCASCEAIGWVMGVDSFQK